MSSIINIINIHASHLMLQLIAKYHYTQINFIAKRNCYYNIFYCFTRLPNTAG